MASSQSYTLDLGSDIILNDSGYDYGDFFFNDDDLMESVERTIIDPGDRDYACNIIIVIWDGDHPIDVSSVATGTRYYKGSTKAFAL